MRVVPEQPDGRAKRLPFANCIVALILLAGALMVAVSMLWLYLLRDSNVIR